MSISASVVITEQVTHQARGWSSGRVRSRQNSYSPAIAITEPSAGVTKYGCLRDRFFLPSLLQLPFLGRR